MVKIEEMVLLVSFLLEFLPTPDLLLNLSSLGICYFALGFGALVKDALERLGELIGVRLGEVLDTTSFFDVDEELLL